MSQSCFNAFYKHWSDNFTICLKVILQNNDIVRWCFSNSPFQYGYYIQTVIVFHWIFLLPTQWTSLYYFMRIHTMWFLPHFFSRCDLFTFKKFCRSLRWSIFSSLQAPWQLLERQWKIMVWNSAARKIYLQIDMYFSLFPFSFSCFEHIECLPVISWFWKFYVPIWALPVFSAHLFFGINLL